MGLSWFTLWPPLARVLFILACLTIILTGLYLAAPLINQVLLAMLLAIMLDPLITRLENKRIPRIVSSLLVIMLMLLIMVVTPQVNRTDARFDATQPPGARAAGGTA